MTDMLHHYSPPEQVDHPHHVTHERPSGEVVTDFHLAGDVLVFRSLADIDGILAALVAAKAEHGAAQARAAAENIRVQEVMPLDAVEPDMRCADDSSALVDVPRPAGLATSPPKTHEESSYSGGAGGLPETR